MNPFTYQRAQDVETAVQHAASDAQSKFIAGGTNLLDLMKENVERPRQLVDINRVPLSGIEILPDGGLRLGALATNSQAAYHREVQQRYPLLAGASPQLRNMATIGGNLMQRTRCYYFYDTATACNKREPGSGCAALDGYNRMHAILGASESCIAVHPSDMCVALAVLQAQVRVIGSAGERVIPLADFHRLPGDQPKIDTNLAADEMITAVDLPELGFAQHYCYLKVRDRASYAFALVSVAVGLEMEGDAIREARVALGGVAHRPWRDPAAEKLLQGQLATAETFQTLAHDILREAHGHGHNDFKIPLARRAIVRALSQAAEGKETP